MLRRLVEFGKHAWRRFRVPILVLAGLAALDVVIAATRGTWRAYSPDDYAEKLRACRHARPEVLVVGGSPVSEGIDPAPLIGMVWDGKPVGHVFQLGLPGATASEVWHAVEHGGERPPRLLVYGISATDLNDRRNEPHGPHSLMSWGDLAAWYRVRPECGEWVTRHFLQARLGRSWQLFRYRDGIRLWAAAKVEDVFPGSAPTSAAEARLNHDHAKRIRDAHGFAPLQEITRRNYAAMKAAGWVAPPAAFLDRYQLGSHIKYVHRMLDWAAERGVAVVLLDMPMTRDIEERYPAAYAQYRAWLADLERERGVRVVRAARDAVGLDDGDFADLIHLNAGGAAKFSRWLRTRLEGTP